MSSPTNMPTRRWSRFSIRVMMLIVLLIAVLLGWQANKAREQREVVAAVQKYGGWVHYDYEFVNGKLITGRSPWGPRWLREMLGDSFFQNVRQVSLVYDDSTGKRFDNSNVLACDDLLEKISKLPGIKELYLKETQTTDKGLRHIGKLTELEIFFIWDAKSVTDRGISRLVGLKNLKNIHISQSNLTDDSLALLSRLPSMAEMSLQGNHFSDEGLARLNGRERLKRLYIGLGDGPIRDAGLAHLKDFKKLETLDLQNAKITAQGLEQLKGLPNLKSLWLGGTSISKKDVQRLQEAIPNLKITGLR
jgi:hypothetical protein